MSSMVLFEAVWLESPASQSGLAKVVEGFGFWALGEVLGGPPGGSWKGPPAALAKKHEAPPDQINHALGFEYSYAIGEGYGRPPMSVPGGVSTVCELACTGPGGEALPSPLRDPLFLTCARAVSQRSGSVA